MTPASSRSASSSSPPGADGTGSLAEVLREMKTSNPADFATYFHSMGIDVDSVALTVVDPATGTILRGGDAVTKVMDDKRLTAVFQRAGHRLALVPGRARSSARSRVLPRRPRASR